MNITLRFQRFAWPALLLMMVCFQPSIAHAQGTAFTYQGRLHDNVGPANGLYDLQFGLWNAPSNPSAQVGVTLVGPATPVSNGLFTVTLDFGTNFPGADRWLEIGVRTNGIGTFIVLSPRQPLTPTPYAIYAPTAGTAASARSVAGSNIVGSITIGQLPAGILTNGATGVALTGTFGGNGAGLTSLNASNLTSGTVALARLPGAVVTNGASGLALSGAFTGNGAGLTNLNASSLSGAVTATNFSGALAGDVTGPQGTTHVANVGSLTAAQVASGAGAANAATTANTPNTIVLRDASGNFVAGSVTGRFIGNGSGLTNLNASSLTGLVSVASFTGSLAGDVTGTQGATVVTNVGGMTAAQVASGVGAAIGASTNNLPNTIVKRDASGNFSAGTVTGSFTGNGAGLTNLTASNLVGTVPSANLSGVALLNANQTFTGTNSFGANVRIAGNKTLQFGAGLAGQEASAGGIGYETFTSDSLDIVGAGTNSTTRKIKFWAEGGANFNGNVGIGTTTPQHKLDVDGNLFFGTARNGAIFNEIGDTLYLGAEQKYLGNTLLSPIGGSTDWINLMANPISAGIMFGLAGPTTTNPHTNTTPLMVIKPNGNVGIGTTTPNSALQVNGTVTANAFAGNGGGLTNLSAVSLTGPITIQQNATSPDLIVGFPGNFIAPGVAGSVIAGGGSASLTNSISDDFSMIGSGEGNAIGNGSDLTFLGGGFQNTVHDFSYQSFIGGGSQNSISADHSFVGGGSQNSVSANHSFVGGGRQNSVSAPSSSIIGGEANSIQFTAHDSFLGGGLGNSINLNFTGDNFAVLVGGESNQVNNFCATVPGGLNNVAGGQFSFAAGQQAQALHDGAFVWGDSQNAPFASTANDQFLIRAQGGVGIGTTTPRAGLDVELFPTGVDHGSWGFLQFAGYNNNGGSGFSGAPNLAIYTSGSIGASTYYAFSDERIKNIIGVSSSAKDLNTLMRIRVTDFTYKDKTTKGSGPVKKVIAQQVESVYPQAVSKTPGVIPDIYQPADLKDGWIQLATNLKKGDRVKLVTDQAQGVYEVLEVSANQFRTDFKPAIDKIFVYGREVGDFRTVDYEAISMLNVSATQELARKVETHEAEMTRLQAKLDQTLAEKEKLLECLAALEVRDQAREDRLARLESSLAKGIVPAKYASQKH